MSSVSRVSPATTSSEGSPELGESLGLAAIPNALESSERQFPIVGIGASAGGLKALSSLLAEIPIDTGMAFVVIQHLDPNHESYLPSLLAKGSRLPIEEAADGIQLQANRVYVITPNTQILIKRGKLQIVPRDQGAGSHFGIDTFLRSLAIDCPGNAIGVILSGTGSDGTLGLAAIKATGGITFAQDDSAAYAGMPLSAIGQGHVDFVLRPIEIAEEIGKIGQFGFPRMPASVLPDVINDISTLKDEPSLPEDHENYKRIMGLLLLGTGVDFTHYRSTTITRRTMRRMAMVSKPTLAEYVGYLVKEPGELTALARDILINVTSFFRDPGVFLAVRTRVLPELIHNRIAESPIRLWVVGCSTGQEVYSLAIELMEHVRGMTPVPSIQIFATDISDWALVKARLGWYPEAIAEEVPPELITRYFTRDGTGYRVVRAIRDLCVFAKHDITSDIPFSRIDFISCRNVLIYLGVVLQKYVIPTFHFSLKPAGFLLLGTSETLGRSSHLYEIFDEENHVYRSLTLTGRTRPQFVPPKRGGDPGMPLPIQPYVPSQSDVQRVADQIVLGRFAPAGVLVTEADEIIQFRGRTAPFLEPAQGEASHNLFTMVPFGVAEALRGALSEAKRTALPTRRQGVAHHRDQFIREINFDVIPVKIPNDKVHFLILFEETASSVQPFTTLPLPSSVEVDYPKELIFIRKELAAATDYIHSIFELNHTLTEQLRETQSEAQSSSEEFRSTNEELQTAKEEVESTNEELVTINDELRSANSNLASVSAELRTSGKLTAAIVDTMRYPLLVLSPNLKVERVNRAFLDFFQVGLKEHVILRNFSLLIHS